MRILAFTDLHGHLKIIDLLKEKAKDADVIVCCGDFTIFHDKIELILDSLDKIGKKMLLIHGNHEDPDIVHALCEGTKNITFLHCASIEFGDCLFFGYGGGGFSNRDPFFVEVAEKFIAQNKDKILKKKKKIVLFTHAPPYGTELDKINGHFVGNQSITDFIKKYKPVVAIAGHIHENIGKQEQLSKTLVINPGPKGVIINIE